MKTAVCGAKEIHFSTQRHRGRGEKQSFLKARQGWPICSNQNQSIFELPSAVIYSVRPKMPLLMELGISLRAFSTTMPRRWRQTKPPPRLSAAADGFIERRGRNVRYLGPLQCRATARSGGGRNKRDYSVHCGSLK